MILELLAGFAVLPMLGTVLSGTLAAVLGSAAQDKASERQRKSALQDRQANLLFQLASRGAALPSRVGAVQVPSDVVGRESAFLPYYFGDQERAIADEAGRTFTATGNVLGTPEEQAARAQAVVNAYLPTAEAGGDVVRGIYDNTLTNQALAEAGPVADARLALAGARKESGLEALQKILNDTRAIQARRGYTGDSLANQRIQLDATRGILGQNAMDVAGANLANAQEVQGIQASGRNLKLGSLNLPTAQAQNILNLQEQPAEQVNTAFNRRLQPFQFFRTGQNPFQVTPLPTPGVKTSPWQILSATTGRAGGDLANAWAKGLFTPSSQYGGYSSAAAKAAAEGAIGKDPSAWEGGATGSTSFADTPSVGSYGSYGGAGAAAGAAADEQTAALWEY